jgi:two-component system chemotaxis response regulator CheY
MRQSRLRQHSLLRDRFKVPDNAFQIKGPTMAIDKAMNVLIVDDYKTMLRIIRNLLKQIDFNNVEEATDGVDALAKMRANNFGLVISDWNMAPMTGLQLLQEVRADARLKQTPFIMITAESKTENVVAAKQAGVSNYIVKPFNAETLKEKIEKVLGHG